MNKKIIIGIGILILVGVIFMLFRGGSTTGNAVSSAGSFIDEGDAIKIPLSSISKKAVWHDYGGTRFFVVESKEGDIKTAFDACDVCYKSRKGYSQKGDDMVCNNCGNYYPISGIGTANLRGGCWPGYLPHKVEGDYVVISKTDLEAGAYRFR
jgi:uncharacterized membrane protein